jgi:hypothetical protein
MRPTFRHFVGLLWFFAVGLIAVAVFSVGLKFGAFVLGFVLLHAAYRFFDDYL